MLIVGRQRVLEALREGKQLDKIFVQANAGGVEMEAVRKAAFDAGVPVSKVPVEKLNNFNVPNHDGCVALISKVQFQDLQQVVTLVVEEGRVPLLLLLDGITDVRNIGGIARTAFCCGVDAIVIPGKGVASLNDDAITASAGALEKIAVCRVESLASAIDLLHLNGVQVFSSEMEASMTADAVDFTIPVAVIMGSEDKGVQELLAKRSDGSFRIPMTGEFESLNVSVAAGMILYEAMQQRRKK
jgi:23S rRNA (guanosine2251-2'-O)-methyltransferase